MEDVLPLTIDRFMKDGVYHVIVVTSMVVNDGQGWTSQKAEEVKVICSAEDDIYISRLSLQFWKHLQGYICFTDHVRCPIHLVHN